MDPQPVNIVALAGSLRQRSFNAGLIQAAAAFAPHGVHVTVVGLHEIPLFSEDHEAAGPPASVEAMAEAFGRADGILIATPEYNGAVPGVLKNALDWLSRFPGTLADKPISLMGATPGRGGTVAAQVALNDLLTHLGAKVLALRVFVSAADSRYDSTGELTDPGVREQVRDQLLALLAFIEDSRSRAAA